MEIPQLNFLDSRLLGFPYIFIKIRRIVIERKYFVTNNDQLKIDDFLRNEWTLRNYLLIYTERITTDICIGKI